MAKFLKKQQIFGFINGFVPPGIRDDGDEWEDGKICHICGKQFINQGGLLAHRRYPTAAVSPIPSAPHSTILVQSLVH